MNKEKLSDAIGNLDDDIIEEADAMRSAPRKIKLPSARPLATAAVIVAALSLSFITAKFVMSNRLVSNDGIGEIGNAEAAGGVVPGVPEATGDDISEGILTNGTPVIENDGVHGDVIPETIPESAIAAVPEEIVSTYPDVTVTAEYASDNPDSAIPTVTIVGNEAASEKINKNEKLANAVKDSISPEGISAGDITYVKTSSESVTIGYSVYTYPGGTHPFHYVKYFNFSLDDGDMLDISDVLSKENPDAADTLEKVVAAKLVTEEAKYSDGTVFEKNAEAIAAEFISGKAYDKWYLTEDALRITYSPYDIAHYAAGYISVEIPYGDIPEVIDERYIPVSDTSGSIRIKEVLGTAPSLTVNGTVSHLTIRAAVNEWDSQVIVYYKSYAENGEWINLGSYQNYWFTYNYSDGLEYVPYENVPGNPPFTVLYGAMGLPSDPEPISKISLYYENGNYTGENLSYTDNASLKITDEGVEFSFSFYQDALDYIGDIHSLIRSLVTLDYEGNKYDMIHDANSVIKVTLNGKAAKLTEISMGKGNGHEDYYFNVVSVEGEQPLNDGLNAFTFEISMEE